MKTKFKIISCLMLLCLCFSVFAFTGCTTSNIEEYIVITKKGTTTFAVDPHYELDDRDNYLNGFEFEIHTKEGRKYTYYKLVSAATSTQAAVWEKKTVVGGPTVTIKLTYQEAIQKNGMSVGGFSLKNKGTIEMTFTIFVNISAGYDTTTQKVTKKCAVQYTVNGHTFSDADNNGKCDVMCNGEACGLTESATHVHNPKSSS